MVIDVPIQISPDIRHPVIVEDRVDLKTRSRCDAKGQGSSRTESDKSDRLPMCPVHDGSCEGLVSGGTIDRSVGNLHNPVPGALKYGGRIGRKVIRPGRREARSIQYKDEGA